MPKKWVLVVDDDPAILEIVAGALEHPELSVTTAGDALQAFIQIGLMPKPLNLDRVRDYIWKLAGIPPAAPPAGGTR